VGHQVGHQVPYQEAHQVDGQLDGQLKLPDGQINDQLDELPDVALRRSGDHLPTYILVAQVRFRRLID
jgi:hypothetical protein